MQFFSSEDNGLIFRENGETVRIEPWGKDSFRVRSAFLGDIVDYSPALLEPDCSLHDVKISLNESDLTRDIWDGTDPGRKASISNGRITADCYVQPWGNALQITFSDNKTGKVLLQEITNGNALAMKARSYKRIGGDVYKIRQKFSSDPC